MNETKVSQIESSEVRVCDFGSYIVYSDGRMFSKRKGVFIGFLKNGYVLYTSLDTGKRTFVHRAVATCFIPNPNNYPFINHIDGVRSNNDVSNLEWCTPQQNAQHAFRIGLSTGEKIREGRKNARFRGVAKPKIYSQEGVVTREVRVLKDGMVVGEYISILEMCRQTGVTTGMAWKVLKAGGTTRGYHLEYVRDSLTVRKRS